jgi:hypothetical protein
MMLVPHMHNQGQLKLWKHVISTSFSRRIVKTSVLMSEVAVAIRDELGELQGTATSSSMMVEHELRVAPIATVAVGPSG